MFSSLALPSLALLLSSSATASALPSLWERDVSLVAKYDTPKAFQAPCNDKVTKNYLPLVMGAATSRSSALLTKLHNQKVKRQTTGNAPLIAYQGQEYLVKVQLGQSAAVSVIVDTGSSDTWLIQSGFKCVNAQRVSQSASACNFGPAFTGTYTGGQIPNENFNISYGDGEFVTGTFGYSDVTVAGITVKKQQVALGNYAYWNGDGASSGLIGLAYRSLTSAFAGTDPTKDTQRINYDPIFTSMYKQGLVNPTFSLALQRGTQGGYIAFGGLPPVNFAQQFTATPIQTLTLGNLPTNQYTFYTITVDGYTSGNSIYGQKTQAIVDSGTTLNYLPSSVAKTLNAAFSPPATNIPSLGGYFVNCNAKTPNTGVKINGTVFKINAADLIFQNIRDPSTGKCLTGIQDGGSGPFILGDVFLQNVVAVFDVGASQMRFAAHVNY